MIFNAKRSKFNSIVSVLDKSPLKSELKTVRIAPKNGFTSKYHARFSPMNVGCLVKTPSVFNCFFHALSCFVPLIVCPSAGFTPWPKDSHERGKGKGKGRVKEGERKNRKGREKGKGKERERKRKGKGKDKKRKWKGKRERKRKGKRREGKGREINRMERKKERKGRGRERKGRGKGEEREVKRGKGEKKAVSHTDHFWCQKLLCSLSFVNPVYVLFFLKWLQSSKKECSDNLPGTFLVQNLIRIRWRAITTTNSEMKKTKTLNSCRTTDK